MSELVGLDMMQKYTFLDFEDNGPKWTTIEIGKPGEQLVLIELTKDWQIIVVSNKRNVYRSSDQGLTFVDEGQISHLGYWGKRASRWWQNWRIIFRWLVNKMELYWLRKLDKWT